jgi:hypothetical protein
VDEGRARRAVLERRDGIVVGRTWELGAAHGEALYVLAETPPAAACSCAAPTACGGVCRFIGNS